MSSSRGTNGDDTAVAEESASTSGSLTEPAAATRQPCERSEESEAKGSARPSPDSLLSPVQGCGRIPPEQMYGLAGDFVRLVLPHTEASAEVLYLSLLVALGNMIGGGPFCQVGATHHSAKLFALVVGNTAKARKGTSWAEVMRLCRLIDEAWACARVLSGLGSGEALIDLVADRDEFLEGRELTDPRLLVAEEEFGRLLVVGRREGSTLTQVVRGAWDDSPLHNVTKGRKLAALEHHISIVGHITLDELQARGLDLAVANGLLNRFLIVRSERSKRLPGGGSLTDADLAPLAKRATDVVALARTGGPRARTSGAERLWAEMYDCLGDDDQVGLFGAAIARAEPQVLRLALVFSLTDGAEVIDVEHFHAAFDLWRFCRTSALWVIGDSTGDHVSDRIVACLGSRPAGATRTELHREFGGHLRRAELDRALGVLIDGRRVRVESSATGGRTRKLYFLLSPSLPSEPGGDHR